jgi:hypothetical protein
MQRGLPMTLKPPAHFSPPCHCVMRGPRWIGYMSYQLVGIHEPCASSFSTYVKIVLQWDAHRIIGTGVEGAE